jgi:hypothetical protein
MKVSSVNTPITNRLDEVMQGDVFKFFDRQEGRNFLKTDYKGIYVDIDDGTHYTPYDSGTGFPELVVITKKANVQLEY